MDVGLILVFLVVFLFCYLFLVGPKNLPPGPFTLPIFGSVGVVRAVRNRRPHLVFLDLAKEYGPVFSFTIGVHRAVVLTGYDVIHEALVKQSDAFSGRPTFLPVLKSFIKDGGGILFNDYNHDWKVLRRFTLQALRDFGVGKSSLEEKIAVEIEATSKWFIENSQKPIDINSSVQKLIGNVIYGIVFGMRYDYDDPRFNNIRLLTVEAFSGNGPLSAFNFFPRFALKILKLFTNQDDMTERNENTRRIREYISEKIAQHEATFDENNIRDFVDLHIKTTRDHDGEADAVFTRGNLFRVIFDLFLAGSETTSTSLDWVFLYMAEYPDVQKRCQAEIEEVVGDKYIQYADREKLPYLNATLMEIQRLSVIVPLSVNHCALKDTTLRGYNIPAGTIVFPSLYSACMDTKYWKQPEKFDPERFLDNSGKLIKADVLIPFSIGPRQCLGEPLARMELFLVFANLIQRFNFRRENEAVKHSMESRLATITNIPQPYKLWVKSRR